MLVKEKSRLTHHHCSSSSCSNFEFQSFYSRMKTLGCKRILEDKNLWNSILGLGMKNFISFGCRNNLDLQANFSDIIESLSLIYILLISHIIAGLQLLYLLLLVIILFLMLKVLKKYCCSNYQLDCERFIISVASCIRV